MAGSCQFEDCREVAKCRGYCISHYFFLKRRDLLAEGAQCSAPNCTEPVWFKSLCKKDFMICREHCQQNGSWSAASEREYEAFLSDTPPPVREKFQYENPAGEDALAEMTKQQEQINAAE